MTDKQTDTKTYNCVYCNKTLTKFETQPLYKDGEFIVTCEECWNKHAKEEGYVVSDVQTINTTIDDKQIIIDNVDVSRCRYYDDRCGYCEACKDDIDGTSFTKCMYEDDCYYKQLKRKEQECDVLRKLAETHLAETINMQREIDQLTEDLAISIQENEEGREINAELKAENDRLKARKDKYYQQTLDDEIQINELLHTLQEIKTIVCGNYEIIDPQGRKDILKLINKTENDLLRKTHKTEQDRRSAYEQALTEIKDYCNKYPQNSIGFKKQILQKCEVINDR